MSPPLALQLIFTGMAMGAIHVLTGPDHLSALATLSANVGNCRAFSLGVGWGIGHSTGLVVVAVLLIIASQGDRVEMPPSLSTFFESFVGIFMLLLGAYGLRKAVTKKYSKRNNDFQCDDLRLYFDDESGFVGAAGTNGDDVVVDEEVMEMRVNHNDISNIKIREGLSPSASNETQNLPIDADGGEASMSLADVDDFNAYSRRQETPYASIASSASSDDCDGIDCCDGELNSTMHRHAMESFPFCRSCKKGSYNPNKDGCSAKILALCIGIVHGVAGPGGVLGVIPAVHLHDWRLATVYLGTFCVTSTVVMGCFAALYGIFSERMATMTNLEFHMECFSAALSILVGLTWIILLSLGKLEDVFP